MYSRLQVDGYTRALHSVTIRATAVKIIEIQKALPYKIAFRGK